MTTSLTPQIRSVAACRQRSIGLILASALLCLGSSASVGRSDVIYNVANYPSDQSGWSLSGTYTVSTVGANSTLESGDVILSNGAASYNLSALDQVNESVAVVGNYLELPPGGYFNLQETASYPSVAIQYYNTAGFADYIGGNAVDPNGGWSPYFWREYPASYDALGAQASVPGGSIGSAPMIIGVLATAPEPSTMILFGLGAIGLLLAARHRRKA